MTFRSIINRVNKYLRDWYQAVLHDRDGNELKLWIDEDGDTVRVEYWPRFPRLFKGGRDEYEWDDDLCDDICEEFGINDCSTGWSIDPGTMQVIKEMRYDSARVFRGMNRLNKRLTQLNEGEKNG